MLHIGNVKVPTCGGPTRRSFLQAGAAGLVGLNLPDFLRMQAAGAVDEDKAQVKNCITLFLVGSPGQLDTFDPKPNAPADIRGPFKPTRTNVTGIHICEHLPLMARLANRYSLIRSLYHNSVPSHETGQQWMQTGHEFGAGAAHPHAGSVIARVFGQKSALPPSIILPARIGNTGGPSSRNQTAGYLGSAHEPFFLEADPARSDFKVANLSTPPGQTEFRVRSRRKLLAELDTVQQKVENSSTTTHDTAYQRAFTLISSPQTKKAFDLSAEKPSVRDRYGRNTFGQSCLLARRLIERGVRFVTINHFDTVFNIVCWDMHADGGTLNSTPRDYERHLLPQLDQAYSALILDLEERGLLYETVVATLSEMGRTSNIDGRGGRGHWPPVWTNFLAGGNIKGGRVIGSSDKIGSQPHEYPIEPPRVLATIYKGLGIDLDHVMMPGPGSRPIRLIDAEPIPELV
ncbi:MAG: DUF1501 domain-containing protein [Planctomycetes bacterium]|nr:DUF1501 domain-containing protein [Planctomycetota bacterium]